jgi:3-hydroxyacyl-[acyl-carrier-protein] dehydratase
MRDDGLREIDWGVDVIRRLLPHRAPLSLVDRVLGYRRRPRPRIRASKHISGNEPVFAGHFPGLHLWPGVYTIEGLGQTCALLGTVTALLDAWPARSPDNRDADSDGDGLLAALDNLERGYRLHPGYRADVGEALASFLADAEPRIQLMGAVDIKLRQPVFAGQTVAYVATLVHHHGRAMRCEVEATVGKRVVAEGTITGFAGAFDARPASPA